MILLDDCPLAACRRKTDKPSGTVKGEVASGDSRSGLAVAQPQLPLSPVPFLPDEVLQVMHLLLCSLIKSVPNHSWAHL